MECPVTVNLCNIAGLEHPRNLIAGANFPLDTARALA